MVWYSTFDAVFFTGIATMVFTCFAIVIKTALASKCDNLNLCFGCIQIHRRVELENIIDDVELNNHDSKELPKEIIINNKENDKVV
jgi:hypothetical protein